MIKLCKDCRGSGTVLGGGFVQVNCETCVGKGKVDSENNIIKDRNKNVSISSKIDKRSKVYKSAIQELVAKGLTEKEAKVLFEEELGKLDD